MGATICMILEPLTMQTNNQIKELNVQLRADDKSGANLLPNTLIIGVQKSSTSWLSARLAQHPEVFVVPGEVHYFDRASNFDRGPDWYRKLFAQAGQARIRVEKSGAYFWTTCENVPDEPQDKPERIDALLSGVRLIVMLRDPVARAYSAWNHIVRSGRARERGSAPDLFDPEIARDVHIHGILTRGLYHAQLSRYLETFPRERILVLTQEQDVIAAPEEGMAKVCRFLDIDTDVSFAGLDRVDNRYDGTCFANHLMLAAPNAMHPALHRLDRYILSRLPLKRLPYPKGDAQTRKRLADYYEDDCRKLADLIGPLPNSWLGGRLAG